jgi:outer membrane protein
MGSKVLLYNRRFPAKYALCLLVAALAAACLVASPAGAITLEESVEMALERSESAGIISDQAGAMRAGARAELSEMLPQVGLDAGYYKLGTNAEPNPLFPSPERQYEATLEAAQLLWAGGRITKGFRLRRALDSQSHVTERIALSALRYKVASMYYGVLFERARLGVHRDRVEQREQELADARALGEAGMASQLDIRQAALGLSMVRDALLAGELAYRQALVDFNIELGNISLDEDGLLVPEGELGRAQALEVSLSTLARELVDEKLPELRMSGLAMSEADLRHGMNWGRSFPELRLVASAFSSGEETSSMDESWMAGLNIKFNLYDGGLRGAARAGTLSEKRRAGREMERTRKLISGRVFSMQMRSDAVDERIRLRLEAVDMAARNYEDARAEYRAGLTTLTRLGEFNLALAEARLGLLGLYLDEQLLMAEAGLLMGRTPWTESP